VLILEAQSLSLAEGDAASVVAHEDVGAVDIDLDGLAVPHDEFVDGVVDDFLQEDVDAVIGGRRRRPSFPIYMPGRRRMCAFQSRDLMLSSLYFSAMVKVVVGLLGIQEFGGGADCEKAAIKKGILKYL
jgi:hypothetical protein